MVKNWYSTYYFKYQLINPNEKNGIFDSEVDVDLIFCYVGLDSYVYFYCAKTYQFHTIPAKGEKIQSHFKSSQNQNIYHQFTFFSFGMRMTIVLYSVWVGATEIIFNQKHRLRSKILVPIFTV